MAHKPLGNSGLEVSRFCLGCMMYGAPDLGTQSCWNAELGRPVRTVEWQFSGVRMLVPND